MKTVKVTNKQTGEVRHLTPSPRCGSLIDLGNWGGAFANRRLKTPGVTTLVTKKLGNKKVYHNSASEKLALASAPRAAISGIYNSCYCKG